MKPIHLPYGRDEMELRLPEGLQCQILEPKAYDPGASADEILKNAMENPIGSPGLRAISRSAKRTLLITNDHTRPMPSTLTIPAIMRNLGTGKEDGRPTILIATGLHRPMTQQEMHEQFGMEICGAYTLVNHIAKDKANLVSFGKMSTGNELFLNRLVLESDLVIAEGFIESHFFAGFSGGRKSILPGVAGASTILANHKPENIACYSAQQACLAGNPIHDECVEAARMSGLQFILNVALDKNKRIIGAFAGDPIEAHLAGCRFVEETMSVKAEKADIVVTSNNGYPLDRNLYQVVKGIDTASRVAKAGGVIVMAARCEDHVGHDAFRDLILSCGTVRELCEKTSVSPSEVDKWQVQVPARGLARHKVILVSEGIERDLAERMFFTHAKTIGEAMDIAFLMAGNGASISVMPEGPVIIPRMAYPEEP
ncbi:MAG: nickel-dependent lactate racemase [Clostridia bacterium]|nr:nickel-dependent lactate racemase [Clostridia bacterium]